MSREYISRTAGRFLFSVDNYQIPHLWLEFFNANVYDTKFYRIQPQDVPDFSS